MLVPAVGGEQAETDLLPDLSLSCLTSGLQIDLRDLSGRSVTAWRSSGWTPRTTPTRRGSSWRTWVTYPQLADPDTELLGFTRVLGLPVTLLLDADGVIVNRHIGALDESDIEELIGEVA